MTDYSQKQEYVPTPTYLYNGDGKTLTVQITYTDGTSEVKTFESHTEMQNYVYLEGDHVAEVRRI